MMSKKDGQVGLINNDGKNLYFKEIFEKLFRKRFDKIIELMDEKTYFIGHRVGKDLMISKNGIKL